MNRFAIGFLLGALGCGGGANTISDDTAEGAANGPCYPNNTCNPGLSCVDTRCVAPAIDSGTPGDTSSTNSDTGTIVDAVVDTSVADAVVDTAPDAAVGPYAKTSIMASCDDPSGNVDGALGDDVSSSKVALPFAFQFFGTAVTQYSMASNGFAELWASSSGGTSSKPDNVALPAASEPNGIVAPFWDDLVVVFSNARAGVFGTAPNRRFVMSWGHWSIKGEMGARLTIQAKLFETTHVIEFHYCTLEPASNARATGSSATIGLENLGGTVAVQHSFNTANAVTSGSALRFTP